MRANSVITYGWLLDFLRQFMRLFNGWWNMVNSITIANFGLGYWILGFSVLNVLIFLVYKIVGASGDSVRRGADVARKELRRSK